MARVAGGSGMKSRTSYMSWKCSLTFLVMLLLSLIDGHWLLAQTAGPIPRPAPGTQTPRTQTPPQERPQIRVSVELVSTPVVVHNSKGELVLNLNRNNFHIFDNGLEQSVAEFDMGGAPLSVAIVVETSSRIEPLLPAIRKTGVLFTQSVLGAEDQAAVIGYHDSVTRLLDFTANRDAIDKTISDLTRGTS